MGGMEKNMETTYCSGFRTDTKLVTPLIMSPPQTMAFKRAGPVVSGTGGFIFRGRQALGGSGILHKL